nr:ribonuclease H-like domain-containing protein [Tanacetum cinerariifolium]
MLKQGDYETWRLRIKQYFNIQDNALWDVIENGNSFIPVAQTTTNGVGTSITHILGPVTNDEKAQKKNDVKERSMLLMALPNEHLMTFNQYKDDKTLFAAIETRFGRNEATTKTQKTLLKQLPNSTNEVPTDFGVGTASPQVSTANLSDATVYAFLANQPNGSQLVHEDLEQIHKDDLEEMDLKWQLALLSMRAKRFFQKTGKKITINRSDTAGFDKSKVECFNCHKIGHFARECRGHSHKQLEDQGYFDSGCSRYMTGNISYLTDFKEFDRGYVAFGGGVKGDKITGKGIIKTGKLDFEDVYFVKELQFNLFSVSQMCDKKNSILFTDTECFVLSPDFKLADESHVLRKVPRKNNMYSVDMKNIFPKKDLTFLVANATND